jgi:predicted hotdog family 3-hydroxylacyl-ACP dehydratase
VRLDRAWIGSHIPHQGSMCLLDEVLEWDAHRIHCRSGTHRDPGNPLRANARLGAACGIEYAAQAMAVHGALVGAGPAASAEVAPPPPRSGYIASVRAVSLLVSRLDDLPSDLLSTAERVHSDSATALYVFSLSSAERLLLKGRATIVFINGPHAAIS